MKKEVALLLLLSVVLAILVSGCIRKTEVVVCAPPEIIVGDRCCHDTNNNSLCDDTELSENASTAGICGNDICEADIGENCTTCWKDCGACKKIVYVYIPRNFTLTELTDDLNKVTRDGIKFTRDRANINNVSEFLLFDKPVPRYFADFMGIKYKPLAKSRWIVLGKIENDAYLVNDSDSLLRYVNASNWYLLYQPLNSETTIYEDRISKGNATADYPTQPTGYQKQFRYSDWVFKNYTKAEQIVYEGTKLADNESVESVYASLVSYNVTYKYHEYDNAEGGIKEAFNDIKELRLSYIHALSFPCGRNMVMTIYDYDYDGGYEGIYYYGLLDQLNMNRKSLLKSMENLEYVCGFKYGGKNFVI
jgi:hypothetical protein